FLFRWRRIGRNSRRDRITDADVRNIVVGGSAMQTSEDGGGGGRFCLKHTCSEAKCNASRFDREKLLRGINAWDGSVVITTRVVDGTWAKTGSPGSTHPSTPWKTRSSKSSGNWPGSNGKPSSKPSRTPANVLLRARKTITITHNA